MLDQVPRSAIAVIDKTLNSVVLLSLFFLAARSVPIEVFGLFNFWLAIGTLLTPLFTLGADAKISNDLALTTDSKLVRAFFAPFAIRLALGTLILLIVVISAGESALRIVLPAQLFALMKVFDQGEHLFYSKSQPLPPLTAKVWSLLVLGPLAITACIVDTSPWVFLWLIPAYPATRNLILVVFIHRSGLLKISRFPSLSEIVRALCGWTMSNARTIAPLLFSGLCIAFYARVDQILIGKLLSNEDLATYAVAVRIAETLFILPISIVGVRMPSVLKVSGNPSAFHSQIQNLSSLLIWLAIICIPAVTLAAVLIERFLLPDSYLGLSVVVLIYATSSVFVFFGTLWTRWMIFEGQAGIIPVFQLTALGLNLALNLWLIPLMGLAGAALATALASAFGHAVLAGFIPRQTTPYRVFYRSLFHGWRSLWSQIAVGLTRQKQ